MPHFKKGDAFVESTPHPLVFMEVNEVEVGPGDKDFCIVTWYSLNESGLNAQRRFPMVLLMEGSATSNQSLGDFSKRSKA